MSDDQQLHHPRGPRGIAADIGIEQWRIRDSNGLRYEHLLDLAAQQCIDRLAVARGGRLVRIKKDAA